MKSQNVTLPDTELLNYLVRSTGIEPGTATRLVQDILSWYDEPLPDYVQRRHKMLQATGRYRNEEIFERIGQEISSRPFRAARPSIRQIRRMIYG